MTRYKACVYPQRAFLVLVQAVKKTAAFLGVLSPGQSQRCKFLRANENFQVGRVPKASRSTVSLALESVLELVDQDGQELTSTALLIESSPSHASY